LRKLIDPIYTSFEGTPHPYDYPSNTMIAQDAIGKGATVAYVHPILGQTRDPFDFTVSAKELPVAVALGLVHVIDIYPWGPLATEIWYKLMNCGLHLAPGAGTDTFSNWRSINQVPGNSRVYVESSQPLGYGNWIMGLKQGRSFVTNGPLISLEVNGKRPGDTIKSESESELEITVKARAEGRVLLNQLELVMNGQVVYSKTVDSAHDIGLEWKQRVSRSGWIALRASGMADPQVLGQASQAHTAAVYLEVGGKPMEPVAADASLFVDWIDRLWDLIEMRNNFQNPNQKEEVRKLVFRAREFYAKAANRPL
jgi:TolB protein